MFFGLAISCTLAAILFGILSFISISNLYIAISATIGAIVFFTLYEMQQKIKDMESKIRILEDSLSKTKESMNSSIQSNRRRITDIEEQMIKLKSTPPPQEK